MQNALLMSLVLVLFAVAGATAAQADSLSIAASERGFVTKFVQGNTVGEFNNGASLTNSYLAGGLTGTIIPSHTLISRVRGIRAVRSPSPSTG